MRSIALCLVFLSNFALGSTDDDIYFKLHQATGFYEQYLGGHCALGKTKALDYLGSISQPEVSSSLDAKVEELRAKLKDKSTHSISELEAFRLSIHSLQRQLALNHQAKWHEDVLVGCSLK